MPPPVELVERVVAMVAATPDVRHDRVAEARAHLAHELPDSGTVAGKLIGRLVSDTIR